MPRQQQARDEGDGSFKEEPRYERLLQRTDVERAWIYERYPDLKRKIGDYLAAKAVAQKTVALAARNETARPQR